MPSRGSETSRRSAGLRLGGDVPSRRLPGVPTRDSELRLVGLAARLPSPPRAVDMAVRGGLIGDATRGLRVGASSGQASGPLRPKALLLPPAPNADAHG